MVIATRPLRGSRLSSFYPPVPVEGPSMSDIDSAFQLQEYISLLIRQNPHDVETIVANPGRVKSPGKSEDQSADKDGKGEIVVDEACWIYEQLRRLAQDLTHPLITSLQQECTRASCPEMKAGEWLYLCVAHGNDGAMEQCCAIDYIIHTLDSATALLNSPRAFPSRIAISPSSIRHFSSLARRLGRIFAHAYFHHREAFEAAEAENALYARFLALTARFDLVPPEFLVIPPRMIDPSGATTDLDAEHDAEPPRLLGAALNPHANQPAGEYRTGRSWSPEKPSTGVQDSPRKMGRSRTDTMIFSDAAVFSEELRGAGGHDADSDSPSASSSGLSDTEKGTAAQAGAESEDVEREESQKSNGIPHVDTLELIAASSETCNVKSCQGGSCSADQDAGLDSHPYTLTFSASGTMKTALPPGVSPSSSSTSNVSLTSPSFYNGPAGAASADDELLKIASETESQEIVPEDTAEPEQTPEAEAESDAVLADLVARKRVLDAAGSEIAAESAAADEGWEDDDSPAEPGVPSSGDSGFVIIGEQGEMCTPESTPRPQEEEKGEENEDENSGAATVEPSGKPSLTEDAKMSEILKAEVEDKSDSETEPSDKVKEGTEGETKVDESVSDVQAPSMMSVSELEPKSDRAGASAPSASELPAENPVDEAVIEGEKDEATTDPNVTLEEDLEDVERALR
ncbi:Mob1/phocein, partial [Phellopilus nigrolimitatus]